MNGPLCIGLNELRREMPQPRITAGTGALNEHIVERVSGFPMKGGIDPPATLIDTVRVILSIGDRDSPARTRPLKSLNMSDLQAPHTPLKSGALIII
jgi:hypothetical protein